MVPRRVEVRVAGNVAHVVVDVGGLVVGVLGADDVLLFTGRNVETVGIVVLALAPLLEHESLVVKVMSYTDKFKQKNDKEIKNTIIELCDRIIKDFGEDAGIVKIKEEYLSC